MKLCSRCGIENDDINTACPECGTKEFRQVPPKLDTVSSEYSPSVLSRPATVNSSFQGTPIEDVLRRAKNYNKRMSPRKVIGPLVPFLIGVLLVCWQASDNHKNGKLNTAGQRTFGTLENVTRTRHVPLFFWPDYSFEVSYLDKAGASHRASLEANSKLFSQHTENGKFTHHRIEVAFLLDDPSSAGLPGALGASATGFLIGLPLMLLGSAAWRSLYLSRRIAR